MCPLALSGSGFPLTRRISPEEGSEDFSGVAIGAPARGISPEGPLSRGGFLPVPRGGLLGPCGGVCACLTLRREASAEV